MDDASAVCLRPSTADDNAFLFDVYASTREDELAALDWDAPTKAAFLEHQFNAQDSHYRAHYAGAEFLVIMAGTDLIGRLYVERGKADIHVIDIALLPAWRGRGIGTRLMGDLISEAGDSGRRVVLYVEANNPARRLYARLGFAEVEKGPVYDRLEWRARPDVR